MRADESLWLSTRTTTGLFTKNSVMFPAFLSSWFSFCFNLQFIRNAQGWAMYSSWTIDMHCHVFNITNRQCRITGISRCRLLHLATSGSCWKPQATSDGFYSSKSCRVFYVCEVLCSVKFEDRGPHVIYCLLTVNTPIPRGIKQAIFCQHQWKVFQLMIHADSCQIVLAKTFLEDVSGSLSNQIQIERA